MDQVTERSLLAAWSTWPKDRSARECEDPAQLAGCYIENRRSLDGAIQVLEATISGQYIDLPRFSRDEEVLALLREAKANAS